MKNGISRKFWILALFPLFAFARPPAGPLEDLLNVGATVDERCQLEVLEKLGWQVGEKADSKVAATPAADVCQTGSLEDSVRGGALKLAVDSRASAAEISEIRRSYPSLLAGPQSLCAYKFQVARAVSSAASKLAANGRYVFSKPLQWSFVRMRKGPKPAQRGWERSILPGKTLFYPRHSLSDAVEEFYTGKVQSECAVGLQIAQMATVYELFGKSAFNESFTFAEFPIGTYDRVEKSANIFFGNDANLESDSLASGLAREGGMTMVGVAGYLGNVLGESYLDNPPDRGENLLIVSVPPEAARAIADAGSIDAMNAKMRKAWEIVRASADPAKESKEIFNDSENTASDSQKSATHRAVDAILASPEIAGIQVFVHPLGTHSLRYHVKRLIGANPRTPYALQLYDSPINGEVFSRYKKSLMNTCLKRN